MQLLSLVFPAIMAYAAASDLLTMRIPNFISVALIVIFFGLAILVGVDWSTVAWHAAAGATMLVVCFLMYALGWIGGGDAKLAAATVLWLGFTPVLLDYLLIVGLVGGMMGVLFLSIRRFPLPAFALTWEWLVRLHDKKAGVPYGIALAAAGLAVYPDSLLSLKLLGTV
ncbi:A24 family peptidase [Methylobacterium nodulans]|uniref:Peptidase A24A prepilin type IV n=1 Tax=Methylobacterium nodulans (strain LMG 21967 / CNCM I-2342 / ORS 2060) TaxID=460265 RepID=B8ICW4_METNO|nr:prepilin peptidase [Methylobacterium nodulans]ACL57525.1 peptidase A24A prepilin type IV [Methylobacterium nodulans ORS 2060]